LLFFKVIVALGLLIVGGMLVLDQQMNIGQFVAAEIIILLVIDSSEKMILNLDNIFDILSSLEKIGQVTDLELENDSAISIYNIILRHLLQ
jgi:ABC-type bacteriocin/lantibiotic exporter with double-glycine peptidase domain